MDDSCFRTDTGNKDGHAVVEAKHRLVTFEVVMSVPLPQPCSAQLAEIRALRAACKLGSNESCTVYTDLAYVHGICHVFGLIWAQSGFQRADGSAVTHGEAISDLLYAMTLPSKLAVVFLVLRGPACSPVFACGVARMLCPS